MLDLAVAHRGTRAGNSPGSKTYRRLATVSRADLAKHCWVNGYHTSRAGTMQYRLSRCNLRISAGAAISAWSVCRPFDRRARSCTRPVLAKGMLSCSPSRKEWIGPLSSFSKNSASHAC